ncbi:MAG: extracellular solute-binding protein [Anaerolineae bacterium]|nr:extracellular solute-binding protein [Anaerolineae bacterium]
MLSRGRWLSLLPWIVAPLLLAWALRAAPLDQAWATLRQLDVAQLAGLALLNGLVLLSFSARWWIILRSQGYPLPYLRLAGYRLAAFGVTYFTPGPQFGGEPVQVLLPERRDGVPRTTAVAAVGLDKSLELLANFAFLAGGVALMAQQGLLPAAAQRGILAAALLLFALPPLFLAAVALGGYPLTRTARLVAWPLHRSSGRLPRLLAGLAASEAQMMDFCRRRPAALMVALAVTTLSWAGMVAEYWLALRFLGVHLSPVETLAALTAARVAYLAALPMGLGALELSQVWALSVLAANPAAGLSLSALIRLRDTAVAAAGVWWGLRLVSGAGRAAPEHRMTSPTVWIRRQWMATRTRWALLALIAVAALALSACQPVLTPPQAEQAPSGQPAATAKPVVITLAYNRFLQMSFGPGPAPIEVIRAEVAKQYPHIDVRLNLMPDTVNGMREALAVWIAAEDPTVDIYGMDTPWVAEFGTAGWAVPLNDLVPELEQNFVASGLDVFSWNGQRLGVPFWSSLSGMFYRTDLLQEAGLQPPTTYDELVQAAQAVTARHPELSGFVWAGVKDEGLVMVFSEMLLGFGGRYFDDGGRCAMNSPQGVAALSFMADSIASGLSPREVPAWTSEEARTRFAEGKAVFLRHNHDIAVWLDNPERSAIAGKWAVMPNPAQPGGRRTGITGGFAFALNPYSDNREEAVQVLRVIASRPVQKGFAIAWGPVQYYRGLYEDPEVQAANPNADTVEPLLATAYPRPPSTRYTELSSVLQDEVHAAITGIKSPQQALDDACRRIDELSGG